MPDTLDKPVKGSHRRPESTPAGRLGRELAGLRPKAHSGHEKHGANAPGSESCPEGPGEGSAKGCQTGLPSGLSRRSSRDHREGRRSPGERLELQMIRPWGSPHPDLCSGPRELGAGPGQRVDVVHDLTGSAPQLPHAKASCGDQRMSQNSAARAAFMHWRNRAVVLVVRHRSKMFSQFKPAWQVVSQVWLLRRPVMSAWHPRDLFRKLLGFQCKHVNQANVSRR